MYAQTRSERSQTDLNAMSQTLPPDSPLRPSRATADLVFPGRRKPDGTADFVDSSLILIPKRAGVYLIHDLRGPLYVGVTENFTRRFHEHFWLGTNEALAKAVAQPFGPTLFTWFFESDRKARFAIESQLIRALRPPCNHTLKTNP